jgi:uncharacterized YkwD family protein
MKKGKKTIITLIAVLLLTTSIGQAQGFTYTIKTRLCNPTVKGYTINNLNDCMRYFKSIIIKVVPDSENKENNNNQNKLESPKTPEEKPQQPQQPQNPTKPEEQNNSSNTSISSVEREVARLVNLERQKAGLAPLTLSEELSKVARIKSQDMADKNYFSHTSPTYGDPFQMMRSFGIKFGYAGENIAKGYRGAESVMNGWMNSSGHRANILNANFKKIGVGYVEARGTTYWTQLFTD